MSADDFTRPERAAQMRQARRYMAAIEKRGRCFACLNRDRNNTYFGLNVCSIGQQRRHPQCERDGKGLRFTLDDTVLEQFRELTGVKNG